MNKKYFFILGTAIVLGLGVILVHTNRQSAVSPELTKPSMKLIAVFADKNAYNFLKSEIDQYVSDIKNDLNTAVELFVDDFDTPQQVRNKLTQLKDKGLEGSVLIGNVPIPYFESDKLFIGGVDKILPSDRYYMDLERTDFIDEDSNGKFEYKRYEGKYSQNMPSKLYWVGRIKPYNSHVNLLKSYFSRNHLYRKGRVKPQKSLLVYSKDTQSGPSGDTPEIYENNMKDSLSRSGFYSKDQISLMVDTSKSTFLSKLTNDYETASINAHGNWIDQQIGEGIGPRDILETRPKPYFYYLLSCSNGDFSKEDYLAGHYLFDGNGLVVIAYTIPSLLGADESKFYMEYLAQGDTFGEAFIKVQNRVNELQATIIGDPTLRAD